MPEKIMKFVSITVLLGVSIIFGLFGRATEMGLAIVAGAIGLSFSNLDKIKKFSGAGFSAEMRDKIEAVVEKETEPEPEKVSSRDDTLIDSGKRRVLLALENPSYTWRFIGGIKEETGLDINTIESALQELVDRGLVRQSIGKHKKAIWSLTGKGRLTVIYLRQQNNA